MLDILKGLLHKPGVLNSAKWYIFNSFASIVRGILLSILLARYLGTDNYGDYAFFTSITSLLVGFSHFGVDNIAIKDYAIVDIKDRAQYSISCMFIILLGSLLSAIGMVCYGVTSGLLKTEYYFLIGMVLLFQFFEVFRFVLVAQYKTKTMALIRFIFCILAIVFVELGIKTYQELRYFVVLYSIVELTLLVAPFFVIIQDKECGVLNKTSINFSQIKSIIMIALPLWVDGISVSVYMRIDQIMIRSILNTTKLGVYSVAVRISECWFFVPMAICTASLPFFSREYKNSSCHRHTCRFQHIPRKPPRSHQTNHTDEFPIR